MNTWPLGGRRLSNVPGDDVQYFRVGVVASFYRILVAQKIFPQIVLGHFELMFFIHIRMLDDRVRLFLDGFPFGMLSCRCIALLPWQVF
jgi:hypothetical protein